MGPIRKFSSTGTRSGLKLVREFSLGLVQSMGVAPQEHATGLASSGGAQCCENRRFISSVRGDLKPGEADVAIVGGGIVGMATAREIVNRFPSAKVVVVEKEHDIMKHQTSHNRCDLTFHFNCRLKISHQILILSF